jgi:hypothetical protein
MMHQDAPVMSDHIRQPSELFMIAKDLFMT